MVVVMMASAPFSSMSIPEKGTGLALLIVTILSLLRIYTLLDPLVSIFGVLFLSIHMHSMLPLPTFLDVSFWLLTILGVLSRLFLHAWDWAFSQQGYKLWLDSYDSAWKPGIKYRFFETVIMSISRRRRR